MAYGVTVSLLLLVGSFATITESLASHTGGVLEDFLSEDDPVQFFHPNRELQSVVKVLECQDATEWYRRNWDRRFGGSNMFDKFYDCSCIGDLGSTFTMTCRLENHCYVPVFHNTTNVTSNFNGDTNSSASDEEAQQVCLNHQIESNFEVNITDGFLLYLNRQVTCTNFTKGGPPMPYNVYCSEATPICTNTLRDKYGYSTEASFLICNDQSLCPIFFQENFDFSPEQAADLCPLTTLGGELCRISSNSGVSLCGDEDEWDTDNSIYINTADCSNVASCAKAACALLRRNDATLNDVFLPYPECVLEAMMLGESIIDEVDINNVTTIDDEGTQNKTQEEIEGDDDDDVSGGKRMHHSTSWLCNALFVLLFATKNTFQL
jgi:hypothetical protein